MNTLRDRLLAKRELPREKVEIPEFGETVYVQTITAKDRDAFEREIVDANGKLIRDNLRARLLVRTVVNELGVPVFGLGDIDALGELNSRVVARLYDVAARMNGLTKADEDELLKNSGSGQPDASPSA